MGNLGVGGGDKREAKRKGSKGAKRTGLYCLNAFRQSSGLFVDRRGSRRVRRLLRDFLGASPFDTFAGIAALVVVVAVGVAAAFVVAVVAVGVAAASVVAVVVAAAFVVAVVAVGVAAAAVVAQRCSIPASQVPCPAAVAPAK